MLRKWWRVAAGVVLLIASLSLLAWALVPVPIEEEVILLERVSVGLGEGSNLATAALRTIELRLRYPRRLRLGWASQVDLSVVLQEEGDAGTLPLQASLVALARLEGAEVDERSSGLIGETLFPGRPIRFRWVVWGGRGADSSLVASLRLGLVPLDGSAPVDRLAWARTFPTVSTTCLGLSAPAAICLGGVGILVGVGLVLCRRPKESRWWKKSVSRRAA